MLNRGIYVTCGYLRVPRRHTVQRRAGHWPFWVTCGATPPHAARVGSCDAWCAYARARRRSRSRRDVPWARSRSVMASDGIQRPKARTDGGSVRRVWQHAHMRVALRHTRARCACACAPKVAFAGATCRGQGRVPSWRPTASGVRKPAPTAVPSVAYGNMRTCASRCAMRARGAHARALRRSRSRKRRAVGKVAFRHGVRRRPASEARMDAVPPVARMRVALRHTRAWCACARSTRGSEEANAPAGALVGFRPHRPDDPSGAELPPRSTACVRSRIRKVPDRRTQGTVRCPARAFLEYNPARLSHFTSGSNCCHYN
jgi:hypothetical protein